MKGKGRYCLPLLMFIFILSMAPPGWGADKTSPQQSVLLALRQVPLFSRLNDSQLAKVSEVADLLQWKAGDKIIEQGKRTGRMLIALESEVQIRIDGKLIVVLPENALVGEIEFLLEVPATADVVLNRDSRGIAIENNAIRRLMDAHPGIGYILMDEIARMEANRLRTNNAQRDLPK